MSSWTKKMYDFASSSQPFENVVSSFWVFHPHLSFYPFFTGFASLRLKKRSYGHSRPIMDRNKILA
jgi:hypothetical protein